MPDQDRHSGDPDMTDARYPERWLNDRRIRTLSDAAFRLFVTANAWSVSNKTDGVITPTDLRLIPDIDPERVIDLVPELWGKTSNGWLILDYADTQTTKVQLVHLEAIRRAEREKKSRQRSQTRMSPRDVPDDAVPGDGKGQDRSETGQDRTNYPAPEKTKVLRTPTSDWENKPCDRCSDAPTKVTTSAVRLCAACGPRWWSEQPVDEPVPASVRVEAPAVVPVTGLYPLCTKCGNDPGQFSPVGGLCRKCKFG